MEFKYSTLQKYKDVYINRNKSLNELLEVEEKLIKTEMLLRYKLLEYNAHRKKLAKELEELDTKQFEEYCPDRKDLIHDIVSKLSSPPDIIYELKKEIDEYKSKCIEHINKVEQFNSEIPEKLTVTNYKAKVPLKNCSAQEKNYSLL